MSAGLRLIIVDCHQLFRECLSSALAQTNGGSEVEAADSAARALALLDAREADLLLAGLDLPDGSTVDLTRQVAAGFPRVRTIILGTEEAGPDIIACLEAGARGYVLREQSLSELKTAIEMVMRGETICVPAINHLLFSRVGELGLERRHCQRLEFLNLTARELEILALIAEGLSNQRVAERLHLSVHTVKNHVHNLLERLGLESRAQAVEHAYQRGWLARRRYRVG